MYVTASNGSEGDTVTSNLISWYKMMSRSPGDFLLKSFLFFRVSDFYKFGHYQLDKSIFCFKACWVVLFNIIQILIERSASKLWRLLSDAMMTFCLSMSHKKHARLL